MRATESLVLPERQNPLLTPIEQKLVNVHLSSSVIPNLSNFTQPICGGRCQSVFRIAHTKRDY